MMPRTDSSAWHSGFERSFLDFDRGIRVGRLDPSQRITQIIKAVLIRRHGIDMICDRWGRGIFWQWICWVPRPNREAKPQSSQYNFSSAKFFISIDREDHEFRAGFQLERAPSRPGRDDWRVAICRDWDWHVMLKALKGKKFPQILRSLLSDGFRIRCGPFSSMTEFRKSNWSAAACGREAQTAALREWGAFQAYWAFPEKEINGMTGPEIVEAVISVFDETASAMNECMYRPCLREQGESA